MFKNITLLAALIGGLCFAEQFIFDESLSGWKKSDPKKVFADSELRISQTNSVRLEDGGMLTRVLELDADFIYELSFYIKGKDIASGNNQGARIMLNAGQIWGRITANPNNQPETGTFDWKKGAGIIDTDKFGGGKITLHLAITGTGTAWFDGLTITQKEKIRKEQETKKNSWEIKLFPNMFAGNSLSFCENLPATMQVITSGKGDFSGKTAKIMLEVPEFLIFRGVGEVFPMAQGRRQLKTVSSEIIRDGQNYTRHEVTFSKEFIRWFSESWFGHILVLDPMPGSSGKSGKVYWSFAIGDEVQPEQAFAAKIISAAKMSEKPCSEFALWAPRLQTLFFGMPGAGAENSLKFWNSLSDKKYRREWHFRDKQIQYPGFENTLMTGGNQFSSSATADEHKEFYAKMPADVMDNGEINHRKYVSVWSMVDDADGIYDQYLRSVLRKIKVTYPTIKILTWDFEPFPYGYDEGGRKRFAQKMGLPRTPTVEEVNRDYSDKWFNYMVQLHAQLISKNAGIIREELPGVAFWLCSDNLHAAQPHVARWCGVDISLSDKDVDVHQHMPYYTGTRYFDDTAYNIARVSKPWFPLIDPAERLLSFYQQYSAPKIMQNIVATAALGGKGIGFWPDDVMPGEYYHAIAEGFSKVAKAEKYYLEGKRCDEDVTITAKNAVSRKLPDGTIITFPDFSRSLRYTVHKRVKKSPFSLFSSEKYLITLFNYDEEKELLAEISGEKIKPFLVKVPPNGCELAGTDFMPPQKSLQQQAEGFSLRADIFEDHVAGNNIVKWISGRDGGSVLQLSDGSFSAAVDALGNGEAVSLISAKNTELLSNGFAGRIIFADRLQAKLYFKYGAHGISKEGFPYVSVAAEVAPYEGANPDPNPLYQMKIERKFELRDGKLLITHKFSNPTDKAMHLNCRLNNYPWVGQRFQASKITLNGYSSPEDLWLRKPEWEGGKIELKAENGILSETLVLEPDAKFAAVYSWALRSNMPRKTVEFLIDQQIGPGENMEFQYSLNPER